MLSVLPGVLGQVKFIIINALTLHKGRLTNRVQGVKVWLYELIRNKDINPFVTLSHCSYYLLMTSKKNIPMNEN